MTDNELLQAISETMVKNLTPIKSDVMEIKSDIMAIKSDILELKSDIETVKSKVTLLELTLENETNRNIQIIAESHLSLDRKLDEALKTLQPNTMYHLKLNHLNGEVSKIKSVLNMT